ncbi:hypothetical protein CDAR_483021 [Caerostris darwini]|uniref:Uncharacterized protein n=1 Tax=Caerostris darwini TaxID=1538125 RepID=A0AAV4MR38_9ARAC|nr:hypothetical protein CDAR_483021 [Caerostris darwini]
MAVFHQEWKGWTDNRLGDTPPSAPFLLVHPFSLLYSSPAQGMCNICLLRETALSPEGQLNFSSASNKIKPTLGIGEQQTFMAVFHQEWKGWTDNRLGDTPPSPPFLLEHPFSLLYSPPAQGMCNICLLRETALGQEGQLNFSSASNKIKPTLGIGEQQTFMAVFHQEWKGWTDNRLGDTPPSAPFLLVHPFSLLYSSPAQGMCNICLLRETALSPEGQLNFSSASNSKWRS